MDIQKGLFIAGAFLGFLTVAIGAFGAHSLKNKLNPEMLAIFEVGVRYQMYHALALILTALAYSLFSNSFLSWAGVLFIMGTLVFSGSLYTLALTGIRSIGAITPIGGVILLFGWLTLIGGALWNSRS